MASWIAIIYTVPLILVLWLNWWPMPNRLGIVLQFVALVAFTIAVAAASMWEPLLTWWAAILGVAILFLAARSAKKWPERRLPATPYGWIGAAVLLVVAVCSIWVAYIGMMTTLWPSGLDLGLP